MAVGAVMSPANPALTAGEISGLVTLSGPSVAFAVKATAGKLPRGEGRTPPCGAGAAAPPRAGAGRPALRGAVAGALLLRVSSPGHVGRAYALRLAGRDFSANRFRDAAMAEEQRSSGVRVCVTGGAGFIGSWLVKKLLEKGYTVHATLRNTGDEEKAGMLRRLVPGAAERLQLFDADLFDAATFAPAIAGCRFVFLVATPFGLEAAGNKYKSTAEAVVDAVRAILRLCEESKTVKRVIHTASISAASPLMKKGSGGAGYKDFISESCWTPLDVDYPLRSAHFDKYILSKLQSEQELLSYNAGKSPAFEVVTLPLGLVAGDTVLGRVPETTESAVSPVSRNEAYSGLPRILQQLLGSLPLVHVDDACDALLFCMDQPSVAGRFLCAAAYPTINDVADHFAEKFPHLDILRETEAVARVQPEGDKLGELGFRYKYGMEEILDSSVACAARLGSLDASKLNLQKG